MIRKVKFMSQEVYSTPHLKAYNNALSNALNNSIFGPVKEAALLSLFFYIMYIDVIHNLMHNTHMAVSYYTHNDLFIFHIHLRHILST